MNKFLKIGLFSFLAVMALVGGVAVGTPSASAACTPGTGVVCYSDLKSDIGDAVVDSALENLTGALSDYWPIIITLVIFFGIIGFVVRNFLVHRRGR